MTTSSALAAHCSFCGLEVMVVRRGWSAAAAMADYRLVVHSSRLTGTLCLGSGERA